MLCYHQNTKPGIVTFGPTGIKENTNPFLPITLQSCRYGDVTATYIVGKNTLTYIR